MRDKYDFSKIFFIDIETVPQYQNYSEVPENFKKHWERKSKNLSKEINLLVKWMKIHSITPHPPKMLRH